MNDSHTSRYFAIFPPGETGKAVTSDELLSILGFQGMLDRCELRLAGVLRTRYGITARYYQYYRDIPVIGGSVAVRLTTTGHPRTLFASVAVWDIDADPSYRISRDRAVEIAVGVIKPVSLRGEVSVCKAVLPNCGKPVFCWKVDIPARAPLGDWEVFIDGSSGEVILTEDRLRYLNGSGLVFDPDPITSSGDTTLRDNDDAADAVPEEAYSEVELSGITQEDDRYILTGPWIDTSPTENRARMEVSEFFFDREDDRFEEVMAYYHIDRQARYVRTLGFEDLPPTPQQVVVNGVGEDMSFFSPHTGIITTGSGGVDDAEDADILLHEYGHALMHQILSDWRGGDTGLLAEGWCDYIAGDRSLEVAPDFQPYILFNWDGHNQFWAGRVLDSDLSYPEAVELEPHEGGQMWSSLLIEVRQAADQRDLWNSVIIDHLYSLSDSTTVPEAAEALLESDLVVADGGFRQLIVDGCETRGIFPAGLFSPRLSHRSLGDMENINRSRRIRVFIRSRLPLDRERLWLIYSFNDSDPDTLSLDPVGDRIDLYQAFLPAPRMECDVNYYFFSADTCGVFSTHPAGAPLETHTFHAGPDLVPPVITEVDSLPGTVFPDGEIVVGARVTDNITVDAVNLIWFWGRMEPGGIVTLQPTLWDSTLFSGRFRWQVEELGVIHYMVTAVDASAAGNSASSRIRSFPILSGALVDDFEKSNRRWIQGDWYRVTGDAAAGDWCYADRRENIAFRLPREAVAELDETWDFSHFERAQIRFWEVHHFDQDVEEFGTVEAREIDSDNWLELARFTGNQEWWNQRTIDLSEFCMERSAPLKLRFRTYTQEDAEHSAGWRIDELELQTDDLVDAEPIDEVITDVSFLTFTYPNPTNGRLTFGYHLSEGGCLELIDLAGRNVINLPLPMGSSDISLNLDNLPAGTYLLKLSSRSSVTIRPVVLVK